MKLLVIGAGFVGACSAAAAADSGHTVLVYDVNGARVAALGSNDPVMIHRELSEEGLADILIRNRERIRFTAAVEDMRGVSDSLDIAMLCVPTPSTREGGYDLSAFDKAVDGLSEILSARGGGAQKTHVVIVLKSTLPIDAIDRVRASFEARGVRNFGVVVNPEFLVEGKAVEGSLRPDRVVVGAEGDEDFRIMREFYHRFADSLKVKYIEVNPKEAAAGKLLANFLLFARLAACFDVVGRLSEVFPGIAFERVREIVKSDGRIGAWGLYDSLFAGGSCFIKDASALAHELEGKGVSAGLPRQAIVSNEYQLKRFFDRAALEAGFPFEGKTVALLGVAFKRGTNDVRNSPALTLWAWMSQAGVASVKVFDPQASENYKRALEAQGLPTDGKLAICENIEEALQGTQCAIICTDWPEFETLGEVISRVASAPYLIMDGRRIIHHHYDELAKKGFTILAVGSPLMGQSI